MPKKTLLMMAKYWQVGRVKTRLAATIGDAAAMRLHRLFVRHLCTSLATCAQRRQIFASPDNRCKRFAEQIDPAWAVFPQGDGDLGQRMWRAMCAAAVGKRGAATVMIGADVPTLTAVELELAFAALDDHDVVLGPARDGGYYLIGLRAGIGRSERDRWSSLFQGVAWSTASVLAQTEQRAHQAGLRVQRLSEREDIDTEADLMRLMACLRHCSAVADHSLGQRIADTLERHAVRPV
jgi:uncharacterized protein